MKPPARRLRERSVGTGARLANVETERQRELWSRDDTQLTEEVGASAPTSSVLPRAVAQLPSPGETPH